MFKLCWQDVEDLMPSELSGGMKKRVALARSIIFDETKEIIEPEVSKMLIVYLYPKWR